MRITFICAVLAAFCLAGISCRPETCECDCRGDECDCLQYGDVIALQEEARQNLESIFVAEIAYFAENNTFAETFEQMNWGPQGPTRYAYFLGGDSVQPVLTAPYQLPAAVPVGVTQTDFTAAAVGNIDCDLTLDVWTMNDEKQLINLNDDVKY